MTEERQKSDTPRCDAKTGEHSTFFGVSMVPADFARQLERELAAARKDAERLDWCEAQWQDGLHIEACGQGECSGDRVRKVATVFMPKKDHSAATIRAAIDAAMSAPPEKG